MLRQFEKTQIERDYVVRRLRQIRAQVKKSMQQLKGANLDVTVTYVRLTRVDWRLAQIEKGFGINFDVLGIEQCYQDYMQLVRGCSFTANVQVTLL